MTFSSFFTSFSSSFQLKGSIESELGQQFNRFELVDFTTQVVAGIIYLMRVQVDEDEFLHVKIIKPLPYTNLPPSVMTVRRGMDVNSPLNP